MAHDVVLSRGDEVVVIDQVVIRAAVEVSAARISGLRRGDDATHDVIKPLPVSVLLICCREGRHAFETMDEVCWFDYATESMEAINTSGLDCKDVQGLLSCCMTMHTHTECVK
jgi:hypothetical protein